MIDARVALAVLCRPRLWGVALTVVLRFAPRGWWRHWPPVPLPAPAYTAFRVHTALGGPVDPAGSGGVPEHQVGRDRLSSEEVVEFLRWCRRMPGGHRWT